MKLSPESRKKAEDLGLVLVEFGEHCVFIKPPGLSGNKLPNPVSFSLSNPVENTNTVYYSECPVIGISDYPNEQEPYAVSCWSWVPGPGPGDFEKLFSSEEDAMNCVLNYLFEENEYFNARKAYEEKKK